jgi:hypothetical protein
MATADKLINFTVTAAGAPAWFTSITPGNWGSIAGAANRRIDGLNFAGYTGNTLQSSFCSAWSGGLVDQSTGEYLLSSGGHQDWTFNGFVGISLRQSDPGWSIVIPGSATGAIDDFGNGSTSFEGPNSKACYQDGRFRSFHGWHKMDKVHAGKIWLSGIDGMWKSGAASSACYSVVRSTGVSSYLGQGLASPGGGNLNLQAGTSVVDRVRNRVWSSGGVGGSGQGKSFWSINTTNNAITEIALDLGAFGNGQPRWAVACENLGLWILGCVDGFILIADVSSGTVTGFTQKTPTGSPSAFGDGVGAVWHPASRSILCWNSYGQSFRKLLIPANPFTGTYTWSQVTGGGLTPASAPVQGTYSKWQIIEDMGNGESALAVLPATNGPVYVYRFPTGGI